MNPITNLDQLVADLQGAEPRSVVIAAGHDPNSIQAAARAAAEKIARVTLVGDRERILRLCGEFALDRDLFTVVDEPDLVAAGARAVAMVRAGEADVLMKGLIGTADYMKLILNKDQGLLPAGNVLSHVTVVEAPAGRLDPARLLFAADVAIIPAPDLETKIRILGYCATAARSFGIARPRAALITASEKVSPRMPATVEAAEIVRRHAAGELDDLVGEAEVAGPLALDLALSAEACAIKGFVSPVGGAADVLVFPDIEAGNVFYKTVTQLAAARIAAAVVGTDAPCVLTSRADSEETKFLSIAMGCRLAGG
ncbi:phosphate butyryltransferase [bacterium]|nr:phosphate butyryltransferase [bacterium]